MLDPIRNEPPHQPGLDPEMLNPLLRHQLEMCFGSLGQVPANLASLFASVNDTYNARESHIREQEELMARSSSSEAEELRRVHNELRILFENIEEVFFSIDMRNRKFIQMSAGCEKLFGCKAERFFVDFRTWENSIHPEDRHIGSFADIESRADRLPFVRYRLMGADGSVKWVETRTTATIDTSGQLVRIDGVVRDISEKINSKIKIRESERRYRLVSENPILGISWASEEGRMVNVNEAFCRMLGYTAEEIYAKHFSEFSHSDDVQREVPLLEQMLKGKLNNYQIEKRYITKSGHIIWVELNLSCVRDESGKVEYFIGIIQDITSKKVAEQLHQKSEANLRTILENTDTAYVLLDTHANILSFNQVASELAMSEFGEPLEERKNYINLISEYRRAEVARIIQGVLSTGQKKVYQVNYVQEDGSARWLHVNMHPIVNEGKKVLGLSIAARDITKNIKIEEQIRQSNERYELVTKATNDVIWDWDLKTNRMYRSTNYTQVFGNLSGADNSFLDSWIVRIHEDDKARVMDDVTKKINDADSGVWEAQYRYYRVNGEMAYVQDRGYILHDENRKPVRMVGAMRDITAEKLFEIEREKITSDLIQRNKDLEQFAYIISHNLRAPVANILGLSNALQENLDESEKAEAQKILATSVRNLDQVIQDLNTILQVKREVSEVKEYILFPSLIDAVRINLSNMIRKDQVKIEADFSQADTILSLRSYVHSIFTNLVSNSIKYRQAGIQPLIRIRSERLHDRIRLVFSDNGMGIDLEKKRDQVFGLYKRFHPQIEGRGIGLFMVKTQVETLGGTISIESQVNIGTTFIIEFPI